MNYKYRKETARCKAIEWQLKMSDKNLSYSELAHYSYYFAKLGKRYGLIKEFKENGIL